MKSTFYWVCQCHSKCQFRLVPTAPCSCCGAAFNPKKDYLRWASTDKPKPFLRLYMGAKK